MIPKPSPSFYLTSIVIGYWYGMNSNGHWMPLLWMILGFFALWGAVKLGKIFLNMFY